MIRRLSIVVLAMIAASSMAVAGESGTGFTTDSCALAPEQELPGSGDVLEVGEGRTFATIQGAVDVAAPGDLIRVYPGEYKEAVEVSDEKDFIRIQGTDRDQVVLNGDNEKDIAINVDGADGVMIENMTAHNYTRHGFYWFEAKGYWGRYLTAYNFGLYGLYAFDSRCGEISDSYASGGADSGFYIGECFPCDAVIHHIVADRNALGYSGTNAGGDLVLRDSIWKDNGLGIVPNSLDGEERPPQRGITIKNNLVENNNNAIAPGTGIAGAYWGGGIVIAGGVGNQVYGNTVTDHALGGIVISPLPDQNLWIPSGNTIWGNTVSHSDEYPDSMDLAQALLSGPGNCWADNVTSDGAEPTSAPVMIQTIFDCGLPITPPGGHPGVEQALIEGAAEINGRDASDWRTWPAPTPEAQPEAFEDMPVELAGPLTEWLPALF